VPLVWMTSSTPRATNTTGQSGRPISDSGACAILPAGTDAVYGCLRFLSYILRQWHKV
jgi:hypothetical protein